MASAHAAEWRKAEQEEYDSLTSMGTWRLELLPPGRTAISCKWVYKVKQNPDSTVSRFKARLVARGFTQIEGLDYEETFAPTARFVTTRMIFSLACGLHWPLEQVDVDTAFLNAFVKEEIYMEQPPGFVSDSQPDHVCRLIRSIYGLKQSPFNWNEEATDYIVKDMGFTRRFTNPSSFVKTDAQGLKCILAVYVDDIVITARTQDCLNYVKHQLQQKYKIKELGLTSWILGIAVERDLERKTILLH